MRFNGCPICMPAIFALAFSLSSQGAEVTVQNDSFVSGQSAVIVGDFVAGEKAGVRLTSPCNGTIVAVQIGWLSGPGGTSQFSIERNIWIHQGNTFPTPGTVLAQLEAPVLTPGFLNEFRYLDENNTQPLNVPVTSGQQFYVVLEFDNPTNIMGGTASVFRDLNGCQSGKNVLFAIPGGWLNFCLFLQGDLVIRAIVDCAAINGACCRPDGTCVETTQSNCSSQGGTYQGNGTLCSGVSCPQPTGACCRPDGTCAVITQSACLAAGGVYYGNGTTCAGRDCRGACCFQSSGNCLNLSQNQCNGANGIFKGIGTACATTVCFPTGACCMPDGTCQNSVDPTVCANMGGVYQGNFTNCGSIDCPDPVGACCFSNDFCIELTQIECESVLASWKGMGTDCADLNGDGRADDCVGGPLPCEPCDLDCNGSVNPFDIQPFLNMLSGGGGGCSSCAGDANADGTVNPFDINDFIECLS